MKVEVFGADWCGPCRMLKGALTRAGIEFEVIDIDSEPNKAAKDNIRGVPSTLVYDDQGKEVKRFVGFSTDLISKLKGLLDGK